MHDSLKLCTIIESVYRLSSVYFFKILLLQQLPFLMQSDKRCLGSRDLILFFSLSCAKITVITAKQAVNQFVRIGME
jgi:hypothetical protein